jgi:ABC-type transport system involved in cytochrome c biogenesis permease subunit
MITRPLGFSACLRPEPRSLDWLFFVNAGLLGLFFALFGSRFVLTPGLALAPIAGAHASARAPTHVISVVDAAQVFTSDGLRKIADLRDWLGPQAQAAKAPLLLVRSGAETPLAVLAEISSAAHAAGFEVLLAASEPGAGAREGGR